MSRADISAGKAHVELYVKNSEFVKGLNRASKQLSSFGRDLATIGASVAAAGTAILAPMSATISVASDMEEQMNKFNVVFGESAKAMREWGDATGAAMGRSQLQMVTFLGSIQDLLVPMGFAEDKARDLSKTISTLAVDLASFNNMADDDVMRDLQAALTGSGEVMKKYGVIVSEARVQQQLLNEGLDPKEATEAQKAMARLTLILEGTTAAQGDAVRSAGSFANQMKALQAAITNVRSEIGSRLLPVVTPFVSRAREAVVALSDWVKANQHLVVVAAKAGAVIVGLGSAIGAVGLGFVAAGKAVSAITFLMGVLANPIALITIAIAALSAQWALFTDSGQKSVASLASAFQSAWGAIKPIVASISQALEAGDIGLAADIAATAMEVAFLRATEAIADNFLEMAKRIASIMADIANLATVNPLRMGAAAARLSSRLARPGVVGERLGSARSRLQELTGQAAAASEARRAAAARSEQAEARRREIESMRDQTRRTSDPTSIVMAQNAAIAQAEMETRQRILRHLQQEAEQQKRREELNAQRLREEQAEYTARKMMVSALQRENAKYQSLQERGAGADVLSAFRVAAQQRLGMVARSAEMTRLGGRDSDSGEMLRLMQQQNGQLALMLNELRLGRAVFQ